MPKASIEESFEKDDYREQRERLITAAESALREPAAAARFKEAMGELEAAAEQDFQKSEMQEVLRDLKGDQK